MSGALELLFNLTEKMHGLDLEDEPPNLDEWQAYLTGARKNLTPAALKQIWFSPEHREAFWEMRNKMFERARASFSQQGYFEPTLRQAADSQAEHEQISGIGFELEVSKTPDGEWLIFLEIEYSLLYAFGPTAHWNLIDSGGHVWASGQPHEGILEALWKLDHETPIERMRTNAVSLVPE